VTIRGRLMDGKPQVRVRVRYADVQLPIWFLVDTGAARTTLLDGDLRWLELDPRSLEPLPNSIVGFGGPVRSFLLRHAELVFTTTDGHYQLPHNLCAVQHEIVRFPQPIATRILELPSVLGRDIIDRFRFVYEHATGTVLLER